MLPRDTPIGTPVVARVHGLEPMEAVTESKPHNTRHGWKVWLNVWRGYPGDLHWPLHMVTATPTPESEAK